MAGGKTRQQIGFAQAVLEMHLSYTPGELREYPSRAKAAQGGQEGLVASGARGARLVQIAESGRRPKASPGKVL